MTSVLSTTRMSVTAPKVTTHCSLRGSVRGVSMRPRNTACLLASPKSAMTQRVQRRGPVQVQAFALIPLAARLVTAGVLFYASMNWVYYRGTRKDAEKYMSEFEKSEKSRQGKLDKLTGKATDKKNQK